MDHYKLFKFPDYDFTEYPKWVGDTLVQNEDEELALRVDGAVPPREEDERKRLFLIAETKSVTIDKRWSLDKIAAAITDAGHDAAYDPTK